MASFGFIQAFQTFSNIHGHANRRVRRAFQVRACETHHDHRHQATSLSRRGLAATLLYLSTLATPAEADSGASGPFNKYIKRKKLDPLDTYIPPVILSQLQFQDLEAKLLSDKPEYGDSRSFLRSGPASALRSNIRAVAQYASEAGDEKNALDAVRQCIISLEDLDSLLLRASRNDSSATVQKMKEKIEAAVAALDRLLTTVPSPILEKCKAIAASYRESTNLPSGPEQVDADTKLLESLL
eukprot:c13981_g1_i1 orf=56-778(+)